MRGLQPVAGTPPALWALHEEVHGNIVDTARARRESHIRAHSAPVVGALHRNRGLFPLALHIAGGPALAPPFRATLRLKYVLSRGSGIMRLQAGGSGRAERSDC